MQELIDTIEKYKEDMVSFISDIVVIKPGISFPIIEVIMNMIIMIQELKGQISYQNMAIKI